MDLNYIPALHNKVLILHIIALKIVITIFGLHRKHFKKEKNKNLTICRKWSYFTLTEQKLFIT